MAHQAWLPHMSYPKHKLCMWLSIGCGACIYGGLREGFSVHKLRTEEIILLYLGLDLVCTPLKIKFYSKLKQRIFCLAEAHPGSALLMLYFPYFILQYLSFGHLAKGKDP